MFKRLLSLVLVVGVFTAVVLLVSFPKLSIGSSVTAREIAVEPKQPQLICPGPVFVNGGDSGLKLGKFTQAGSASIQGRNDQNPISFATTGIQTIEGSIADSKDFNAVQSQKPALKQAAGLAVANCQPGTNDAWFVAGDNSVGREALLVLVNPTKVDATVSLQLLGTNGPIQGTGLSGISVPAGKVTVLPLSAFAPKASTFAFRVTSRGAALGMWLQQKTIRGLTPGGLDFVEPTATPAKTLEIPGVLIRSSAKLLTITSGDQNFIDTKPILRVVGSGESDATFIAQVQGADGSSFGTVIQGTVTSGAVKDFDLGELADGDYVIHIESNEPIMASASFSRIGSGQPDFAWAIAVTPQKLDAGFTTISGAISKLSVSNPGQSAGVVTLNGRTLNVPAKSNTVIPLAAGTSYQISSNVPIATSQVIDLASTVAVVPVLDYRSEAGRLKVVIR
jgi:hypothetical protein